MKDRVLAVGEGRETGGVDDGAGGAGEDDGGLDAGLL